MRKSERLAAGKVDARIDVEEGYIRAIQLFGDFSGRENVTELEARLIGVGYDREQLVAALAGVDLDRYFGQMDAVTLIDLLY